MAQAHDPSLASWKQCEELLEAFENAWLRGERPELAQYLSRAGVDRAAVLGDLARTDLECRLKAGERARVEDYFRFGELAPAVLLELMELEWEQRCRRDETVPIAEFSLRFPQFREKLAAHWQNFAAEKTVHENPKSKAPSGLARDKRKQRVRRALKVIEREFDPVLWQACWAVIVAGRPPEEVARDLGLDVPAVQAARQQILQRLRTEMDRTPP